MSVVAQPETSGPIGFPWPEGVPGFHPRRWLRNGHLQTIAGNLLPRPSTLPEAEAEMVEVAPARHAQIATRVLCECHWQPAPERAASPADNAAGQAVNAMGGAGIASRPAVIASRPAVILVHGLEGSSRSQYIVGNATKLWAAGFHVIRMNMRNCGGTDHLAPTLYHSGLSGDLASVLHHFVQTRSLQSVALLGYSMGGNLVLKLAGELGRDAPAELRCVVGVSPVVDLAPSADALHEPANRLYEKRFLRALLKRFRRKTTLFPRAFDAQRAAHIGSIREFDERITALYSGFRSADDYYERAAAARVLDRIAVPGLLLHACDDPFIRMLAETRAKIAANPHLTMLETPYGGHCAFLSQPEEGDDGYWAEHTALRFILAHAGEQALRN